MDGFVLAGGASRRMGTDKARVLGPDGRRLVEVVVDALAPWATVRVVRRAPGGDWPVDVVVGEEGGDHHPLWGVAVALEAATSERVLLAPCDLGGLSAEDVEHLVAAEGEVVATDGHRDQPLLAILRRERAAQARAAAAAGGSVMRFVRGIPRVVLPARALRNVNRLEDLD